MTTPKSRKPTAAIFTLCEGGRYFADVDDVETEEVIYTTPFFDYETAARNEARIWALNAGYRVAASQP